MHADALERLRAEIAQIEGPGATHPTLPFGVDPIDRVLGGGLATGALHDIGGGPELPDDAAATIFLAGILARSEGPVFWCLRWRDLFAPALDLVGLDPDRVIFVEAGSDTNVLIAMEECLRHGGLGGVVGEVAKCSLTASRRLQLAAEKSGVSAFVFRRASPSGFAPGTAAVTRWRVEAILAASLGLPALGRPRWRLALERVRGGEPQLWTVEACDAQGRIALSADLADGSAAAEIRQAA
jgi:protein ImuA